MLGRGPHAALPRGFDPRAAILDHALQTMCCFDFFSDFFSGGFSSLDEEEEISSFLPSFLCGAGLPLILAMGTLRPPLAGLDGGYHSPPLSKWRRALVCVQPSMSSVTGGLRSNRLIRKRQVGR